VKLAEGVFAATAAFPDAERFGLTAQLRRAAVSVPSNIADGQARQSKPEFRRFLRIARGSLAELETPIELSLRLKYVAHEPADRLFGLADEVGRLLSGLIRSQVEK
jgi:four helix bundle protein